MRRLITLLVTLLAGLYCASPLAAEAPAIPDELQDWQQWVLHDTEHRQCPYFLGQAPGPVGHHQCAWPGLLTLDLADAGAGFGLDYEVLQESWIGLPGNPAFWPDQVTANGKIQTVIPHNKQPALRLPPGRYRIAGQFVWDKPPESLRLPPQLALYTVTRNGQPWPGVQRRGDELWLSQTEQSGDQQQATATNLTVMRKITDGIPLMLTTVIDVDVAGPAREELLGRALPDGFAITRVRSELPLRIDNQGRLIAQLRAGGGRIEIRARALRLPELITAAPAVSPWPSEEIWSFELNPRYRVAQLDGVPPVDGREVQTQWPELPSYLVQPGDQMRLVERSRGPASDEANQLALSRQLWLDFDAAGFSFEDQVGGRMIRDWRLDLQLPLVMQSASSANQPLMITTGAQPELSGVQALDHQVNLQTTARLEGRPGHLPVSGYTQRMDRVDTLLNLPPGYRLIAADADRAPQAWIERWDVLDLFLVLVIAAAAWRALGPLWGVIASGYLLLGFHEGWLLPVWSMLILIISIGLLKLTPTGTLQALLRAGRNLALLTVVLMTLPFVANQLHTALHPQLETQQRSSGGFAPGQLDFVVPAHPPASMPMRAESVADAVEEVLVTASKSSRLQNRYQKDALIQAGYGRPRWSWNQYQLSWNGPITPEQQSRLVIAPAWLISLLRFVLSGLLVALLGRLIVECFATRLRSHLPDAKWLRRLSGSLVLIAMTLPVSAQTPTQAPKQHGQRPASLAPQTPDADILQQLGQRLLEPEACAPHCASIDAVSISATGDRLSLTLEIHSADRVAVPLPITRQGWHWTAVTLDGQSGQRVYRRGNQPWLAVEPGIHSVVIEGRVSADQIALQFPLAPKLVQELKLDGWQAGGIQNRRLKGGITLIREVIQRTTDQPQRGKPIQPPAFARLHRIVSFDLQWQTETLLQRVAPAQGAISLPIALLPGEAVQSNEFEVRNRIATVNLGPDQRRVDWRAQLQRSETLTLTAADRDDLVEVWTIAQTPLWQLQIDGVPFTPPDSDFAGAWELEYFPRRGETLTVQVRRPEALAGATVAIDKVDLSKQIGERSSTADLQLALRASRAAQHTITLPGDAEVTAVTINGRSINLRPRDGQLVVPVAVGKSNIGVNWRESQTASMRAQTSTVDVGAAAANINLKLTQPGNRWVLWTSGPRRGPAILYWAELLVMIGLAWALGKTSQTPLKFHHWLLMGLGFSTFSWPALLVVVAWLFALAWRGRQDLDWPRWRFNLLQLALIGFTVIALGSIVSAIPAGLLGSPDMHIQGGVGAQLGWFHDRSSGVVPLAQVWSVPLWWYKALMLVWALWLALALTRWLPWAWRNLVAGRAWQGKLKLAPDQGG